MNKCKLPRWVLLIAFLCGVLRGWSPWQDFVVASQPPPMESTWARLEVLQASIPGAQCQVLVRAPKGDYPWRLLLNASLCPLAAGQRIWVASTELRNSRQALPGVSSEQILGQREGISNTFIISKVLPASARPFTNKDHYWRWVAQTRQQAWEWSQGNPARAFVMAVTLGLRTALPPQQRDELRTVGLGHLIAVSGMHIGICALLFRSILLRLSLRLGVPLGVGVLLSCIPVFAYVGLTGASPSAIRAAIMFLCLQMSVAIGKPSHGLTSLALTGALMLAWQPVWASSPGFQLSMTAMMVLVRPQAPRGLLAQSWHITWVTMPIALLHFGQASVYGMITNLLAVPVFTLWVIPLGLFGHLVAPWVGPSAFAPATLGAELILDLSQLFAQLPSLSMNLGCVCAGCALGLRLLTLHPRLIQPEWRKALPSGIACAAIIALSWPRPSAGIPTTVIFGSKRSITQIVPARDLTNAQLPFACIQNPSLAIHEWPALLTTLGYQSIASIEGAATQRRKDTDVIPPPHIQDLQDKLKQRGLFHIPEIVYQCSYIDFTRAKTALQSCLNMSHQSFAMVRLNANTHSCECFREGTWYPLSTTEDFCS